MPASVCSGHYAGECLVVTMPASVCSGRYAGECLLVVTMPASVCSSHYAGDCRWWSLCRRVSVVVPTLASV